MFFSSNSKCKESAEPKVVLVRERVQEREYAPVPQEPTKKEDGFLKKAAKATGRAAIGVAIATATGGLLG